MARVQNDSQEIAMSDVSLPRRQVLLTVMTGILLGARSGQAQASQLRDSDLTLGGASVIRDIAYDICFPATAEEYVAMGKHAILLTTASSAISTELPLKAVYVVQNGIRILLQKIATIGKFVDPASQRGTQNSYYLLPIQFMKADARLLADFTGGRTAFGIVRFSKTVGLDSGAPAFARLDEYDGPFDPDMRTVESVLRREFPSDFV